VHALLILNVEATTMAVAAAFKTEKGAAALAPLPLVFGLLFAGFFVNLGSVGVWLSWIRYLVPFHWCLCPLACTRACTFV
jgi:membrane protein DedA with SNARE-associated domain